MYPPMKTARQDKGEVSKKPGIWLGVNERTEEILVGTRRGVIKCHTVSRLAEGEQWDREAILAMKGLPWEPVPGKIGQHIPTSMQKHDVF